MKVKNLVKLIGIVVCLTGLVGAGLYIQFNQDKAGNTLSDELFGWKFPVAKFPLTGPGDKLAYSDIRDPGGIPQGLPVRLKVPIIGVDSAIEDALITPDGRMDVPVGSKNVAWFSLGPHPGKTGSAVIGGHFGITKGVPFVFYKLDQLKKNDKIYIVDDKGNTLTFIVRSIKLFDRNADATTVFTSNDDLAHLNLITCEGIWNRVNDSYPQRRVVFTDLIPTESAIKDIIKPAAIPVSEPSLNLGARGADVVALQTALQTKGLLIIPPSVSKGFFGTLTRVAVVKYQASVGLPSNGIFDPLTKAKLFAEKPAAIAKPPSLPKTAIPTPQSTATPNLIQSAKSLYATPLDGLISSVLLLSIIGIAFKVIRR